MAVANAVTLSRRRRRKRGIKRRFGLPLFLLGPALGDESREFNIKSHRLLNVFKMNCTSLLSGRILYLLTILLYYLYVILLKLSVGLLVGLVFESVG